MAHFIEEYWLKNSHLWGGEMITRFPPEPNGHSHAGHAKAMWASFGMAAKFGGRCHLRMDDTNPEKESEAYADSIKEMVAWMGFKWDGEVKHTSDYFDELHALAVELIKSGDAYMDFTSREKMREMRGTLNSPGERCEDAENFADWHLDMFEHMRDGAFDDGECVLRARIDMASPNMNMRDPVLYRVKKMAHNRTGDKWCIYPAYSYAHPASDYIERIALSLCTLEFEDLRPFYDWVVERCIKFMPHADGRHPPVELEFARLELDRGMTSKRKINALVESGSVDGWDDPRLVTLAGLRRRGFTPSSIRKFCEEGGLSKSNATTPFSRMEDFLRLDLDPVAPRRVVVANPVALDVIGGAEGLGEARMANHPKNEEMGSRPFATSSRWWVDASDVRAAGRAEKGFKRVEPGSIFRIMPGVVLECVGVEVDASGAPVKVMAKMSDGKPRSSIHGLAREVALPVDIWEPAPISECEGNADGPEPMLHGFAEPSCMGVEGAWQAIRYGYCSWDSKVPNRLILAVGLRGV